MTGLESILTLRQRSDTCLLAFSRGKDALACWLVLREHFPVIIPYHMYLVPRLEFVEESLHYYEKFFQTKIYQLPHPSLYRMLNNLVFQPPERARHIEALDLPVVSYDTLSQEIREHLGLGNQVFSATGVRAADSPIRRVAITKHGCISEKHKSFMPVWDLLKKDLVDLFRRARVKLPIDYKLWGRSFDGLDYRFLEPLSRLLPRDYQKVLEWFPLADLELYRRKICP